MVFKMMTRIQIFLYRISRGKIWKNMLGMPVLLLTASGRKSGQPRTTPVVYLRDNDDHLIAASKGGSAILVISIFQIMCQGTLS